MPTHVLERPTDSPTPWTHSDTLRRRAYLFATAVTALLLTARSATSGLDVLYWGYIYPALAVLVATLFAATWFRWLSFRTTEALALAALVAALFGFLAAWRYAPHLVDADGRGLRGGMLWAGMAFPLCFLVFGTRRGLHVSVVIYATFLGLLLPPAIRGDMTVAANGSVSDFTASLVTFFAVLVALLAVLASRLEELASARTRAELFAAQATTDQLTGLANRRRLDDDLASQLSHYRRHGTPLSVLLIDIDHFKTINDQHGHVVGDRVLQDTARVLTSRLRASDVVGRYGGDEFIVLAVPVAEGGTWAVAEAIREAVANAQSHGIRVTVSIGIAEGELGSDPQADYLGLIERADSALYTAKSDGRNRVSEHKLTRG